jgi:hypothetical protein
MNNIHDIPDNIWEAINYVLQYANTSEDWLAVKKEILWLLTNEHRHYFSRRHYSTKKHSINDFEKLVIEYWYSETGKRLTITDNLIHNPEWVRHRRGWGLKKYNKERQKNALKLKRKNKENP